MSTLNSPKEVAVKIDTLMVLTDTAGPWTPKERMIWGLACDEFLMCLDAMAPLKIKAKHAGLLPDMVHLMGSLNLFEDARQKPVPLLHLLSKALPQRCQFRNFREIARGYCSTKPLINDLVRSMVFLSIGGYYPHVRGRIFATTRMELYQYWYGLTNEELTGWVSQNSLLVFYVIKEFLISMCEYDSALMVVVRTRYNWDHYVRTTMETMTMVRRLWGTPRRNDRGAIMQELQRAHTRNCKHLQTLPGASVLSKITTVFLRRRTEAKTRTASTRTVAARGIQDLARTINNDSIGCDMSFTVKTVGEVLKNQTMAGPGQAALHGNHWDEIANAVSAEKSFPHRIIHDWDADVYATIEMTVLRLRLLHQVRVVRLPLHFLHAQYHAVCARYDLHPSATSEVERVSSFYICLTCQSFKGFAVDSAVEKTRINVSATGHDKVAYDDETGFMTCSKHKNERQTGPNTKYKQRVALLHHLGCAEKRGCERTRCLAVNLLGNLVLCFGTAYSLCFGCGAPCVFRQGTSMRFTCGCCESDGEDDEHCLFCRTKRGSKSRIWSTVWTLNDVSPVPSERVVTKSLLCPAHTIHGMGRRGVWLQSSLLQKIAHKSGAAYGLN